MRPAFPPTLAVLLSITSTQIGSALAKGLFTQLSPAGVACLRVGFAALILLALRRPQRAQVQRSAYPILILFGLSLALMNLTFYLANARIPLAIAVTLEFLGPLGVSITHSRRWIDGLWVTLAAVGILLLVPIHQPMEFDGVGILLALTAGGFWASYILLAARVGQVLPGGTGLTWAMTIGAVGLLPIGIISGGAALLIPQVLLVAFGVALLSSALPYSLEFEALRWLPVSVFGVLLSLEPAAAALMGFLILGETLTLRALIAVVLVSIAAAGASRFSVERQS